MTDHKRDYRKVEIEELYCTDPACEFNGKRAQQGVCFNTDRADPEAWERIFAAGKRMAEELLDIKRTEFADDPAEYIRWLEAMYETTMMNLSSTLDELVCLRVENRRLKEKAASEEIK